MSDHAIEVTVNSERYVATVEARVEGGKIHVKMPARSASVLVERER